VRAVYRDMMLFPGHRMRHRGLIRGVCFGLATAYDTVDRDGAQAGGTVVLMAGIGVNLDLRRGGLGCDHHQAESGGAFHCWNSEHGGSQVARVYTSFARGARQVQLF